MMLVNSINSKITFDQHNDISEQLFRLSSFKLRQLSLQTEALNTHRWTISKHLGILFKINRLNSGIKNRNYFFAWAIFLIQKIGTNAVINFWKCVGGVYMRGCLILQITQSVQLVTLINFIYKIRGVHLIPCQPTQFQPP